MIGTMYELYAFPNTYALGAHLILEESGVVYQIIDVSQENTASDFQAVSPHQRVPALRLENGQSLFESGAIALHLADSLCEGIYSVKQDSVDRAEYLQWLFYFSSTLQPEVMLQFHPEHYFADSKTQQALKESAMQRLVACWAILEKRYSAGPWMFDSRPTAVDFSLANVLRWPECFPNGIGEYPNLQATLEAISQRQACKRVFRWHSGEITETGNPG